ncbi:MAG: hypothetical protein MJ056_03120 [Akkermansia sp.]|nr:hypothetical protein [Akkermansia sp.]
MKLHLPTGLRAALIAAFAVTGTLAQAGITMTDITQWDGYDATSGVAHVGNSGGTIYNAKQQQPDYQWNNYWNFVFTVDAATLTEGTYSLETLALTQKGAEGYVVASSLEMDGSGSGTVTHGGWNQAGSTAGIDLSGAKDITFVLSRNNNGGIVSLTGYVDGNFDAAAFTLNVNTNLSFSGTPVSTVSYGSTGGLSPFNIGVNTYRQVADDSVGSFDITRAGYLLGSQLTTADLVKYYTPPSILEWHGTSSGTWDLSTPNWVAQGETEPRVFVDYATAVFGSGSSLVKNIEVDGTLNVDVMNVQADYTFTAGSGSSLMVDTLNVAAGKTATVAGEGDFSVSHLTGAVSIAAGASLTLDGTITLSGTQTLPVSGEGKLEATTLQVTGGTHTITNALEVTGGGEGTGSGNRSLGLAVTNAAASVTLAGATNITGALYAQVGTVNIGNGTDAVRVTTNRVEFGDTGGAGTSTLNVNKNATLRVKAGAVANASASTGLVMGEWGGVSVANIYGKLYAQSATASVGDNTVTFNIQADGLMAVQGFAENQFKDAKTETINLNLLDDGTLVLGENGITGRKPVNINFAAGEVGISAYNVQIAKDVTVSGSGTTFNTNVYEWTGSDDTLELQEGSGVGTLTISGNITGDGTIILEGDGTLALSGANNVLTHTISANSGNLTLSGSYEISDIASVGVTTYAGGQRAGNGYATANGTITVYSGDATVDDSQAAYTYHGEDVTVTVAGGVYTLPGEQDNTTYFINAGTDSYTWIDDNKPGELTGGIVVKEGATLQADKAMSMAVLAASSKGTVQIDEGIVVSADGGSQHVALTGKGTYALAANTQTLGSVDASGLEGWVRLSGTITDLNLDGNLQDTNVELSGVSGYLKDLGVENDDDFTGNLRLTDADGTPALLLNNGYSRNGSHYVLSGEVTGDGTWRFQKTGATVTNRIVFNGDISGWEGTLDVASGYAVELTFARDNGNVNATITREGGTLRLFANADTTFNAVVTGTTSTTVAEGKTATFASNEDSSIGGISGAGILVKNGTGTLTVSGAPYTGTDTDPIPATVTINVNAGTLKATTAGTLGGGSVNVATGATLEMTTGDILGGTQTVTNSGNVLLHQTFTKGTINGGTLTLASDFPVNADLLDVEDKTTGNGFSQGGSIKVYDPAEATLSTDIDIVRGDTHYTLAQLVDGTITLGGSDWSIYQYNIATLTPPSVQEIIDFADTKSGTTGALSTISVNADGLYLVDDSTALKTSMLSGEHLDSFQLLLDDGASLLLDEDFAGSIQLGVTPESAATLVLDKDVSVGEIMAYDDGNISTLTVTGAHTLSTATAATSEAAIVLESGAHLAVTEQDGLAPDKGDTVTVKGTAELSLPNVSIKSVNGSDAAVLSNVNSDDAYSLASADHSLANARVTVNSAGGSTFGNAVSGSIALVNAGTGVLTDATDNTAYTELAAQGGNIVLGAKAATVGNLTVGDGRGISVGGTGSITVNGIADLGSGAKVGSALTMAAGSTLDGTASLENHALSLESGINISNDLWSTLTALDPEESTNIFTGVSALTLAGAEYTEDVDLNTIFTHASLKPNKYMLGYKDGNVVITKNLENNRYWKGGSGTWDYSTTNLWTDEEGGADAAFVNGYNAHFTSASDGVITLGEDITATNVYVSGANYGFKNADHTLTVTNLFEVNGSYQATLAFGLSGENLKLSVKNGGTLVLNGTSSVKAVEIGSGELSCNSGELTVTGSLVNNGSLYAEMLTLSQGTAQGGNVSVGTLNLADNQSYTFGNLNAATISGTGADLTIGNGGSLSAAATLKSLTTGDSAQLGGNITVAGATNIGGATLTGSLTTGTLTGGPLSVSGGHLTLASGSLNLVQFAGTSSLTASGAITLDGALQNYGDLTLTGTYDASNLPASKSDSKYVEGGTDGNGFEQARLTLTIVNGGTTSANDATIVYRTKTLTEKVGTNGKVTFDGDVDYTKFYVNSGTEKVSTAMDKFSTKPGTFVLNSNTTLVVDHEGISLGMVNMPAGAALLQIESGYTVATDGSSKNLMLTGAGELAVDEGKDTPGVVYHATEWTGTVSLRDVELTQLDSDWGTANSTVALQNASGALGNAEVKYDLELRKGAGDSWGYGGTSSTKDSHLWLNGDLKGDGDLGVKSGTATSVFELNGNTDAWTGNFIVATDANATLKLTGGDKTINGTVTGSNLALVVETNATLKSDSAVARVKATAGSLKVDAGKRLTVTGTILPDNIKLGAGASIAAAFMGGTEYGYMDGTIANETGGDQDVTINNADITVTGATLCTGGGTGFTVDNKLVDAKLLVAETLTKAVALNNVQDSLEVVDDLAIGSTGSLKVANGGSKQELLIGGGTTLTLADGTTLDANVAIGSGATLTLNYNTGGTPVATTLNSGALSLANGLTLSGNVYNQMAAFTDADDNTVVDLFRGVGALTLGGSAYSEEVKASQYFTNLTALSDLGDYTLLYNDSTDTVSIRFNVTQARTLTWNGTEGNSTWEVGEGTAENWLDTTPEETYFKSGDNALFTDKADKKLVTIAEDITARNISVTDARYLFENEADHTITADQFSIQGSTLSKKGAGELVLDIGAPVSVKDASFEVQAGSVVIGTPDKAGTLELTGAVLDIAFDASLTVATIHADAGPAMELGGTLTVANGSLVYLTALVDSTLRIADVGTTAAGTLTVGADTYLHGLENHGTLDLGTHELTLKLAAAQGGNVTAGNLKLAAENGNTFGDLKANSILYAYGANGAGKLLGAVNVDTIAANGAGKITLDLTDVRGDGGSLAPIQRTGGEITYTLIHADGQTLDAGSFTLDASTLEALVQNGLIHEGAGLTVTENDVKLTIGGQDLTWYTGSDTTEWGYNVMSGDDIAHGANTLNGVQHVVVDEDRTVDVTGVGANPGLRVRNIIGTGDKTLTFTGEHGDAVALIATEDTSSDVNVAAEHIQLGVGLPETDAIDPIDYEYGLHVGSVKLTDARLVVTNAASFSVDRLNGDEDSTVSGAVAIVGQGGAYRGGYAGAAITVAEDAEATLYAGEPLKLYGEGTVKPPYTKSTEIDGVNADGMTLVLNNPNASIIGSTLTMQDESGLTNGTLVFGMSAIESAKRIDSTQTPQIIEGSLVLGDGTTVVVNQDALADSGIAMAVNNHGVYRNLALAYIGNEETDTKNVQLNGYLYGKYYKNARIEAGELLVDMRDDFYRDRTKATTENGIAGAGMLDDALLYKNPQVTNPEGDLAAVMNALETDAIPQRAADKVAAAMSGASHAALGAAWSHDVDRQLRAIRNRTTQMGMADCVVNEDLPYFNAWINAEGDYGKMNADSTLAGYKLSSWGGTLGVDVDLTPRFTFGAAVTAMSGDFTADSAETAEGDLDRMYVTVFGRYSHRAWSHTLVATYGMADTNLKRTVDYGPGSYTAESEADGTAFGVMYEVGYAAALNEDASTCLQPVLNLSYRHSSLDGGREKSRSDAALKLGDAEANVFTVALGARLQSTVGTSVYNRATLFEGRVLCKVDSGDRDVAAGNGFTGIGHSRDAKSAEMGLFGVEVGAGITIPVAERGGALFLDVTGEFRAKYTEINGTVGYRFNF